MADSNAKQDVSEPRKPRGELRESRQVAHELVATFARSGPAYHPIIDKFESDHVTQFLQHAHEQDKGEREFRRGNRWFRLIYTLVGVAVFAFLTLLLLPEQANLYLEILKGLGIFAAGAAGGYGLKAYQDSRQGS